MPSDFSRTLALLRREKRISQRTAAGDLQVSQALLSHYENGLREPGLSFVVRAADYYGVSCDYLLGRSMSREGGILSTSVSDPSAEVDGASIAAASRKLIADSSSLLLEAAAKSGSSRLVEELTRYLAIVEYKLFRYLYHADPGNPEEAFRTKTQHFDALCDARLKLTELRIRNVARGEGGFGLEAEDISLPSLAVGDLSKDFPQQAQSLLTVLQRVSDYIEELDRQPRK